MKHLAFLLVLSFTAYALPAHAQPISAQDAEQVITDYFAAFGAYDETATYDLTAGTQTDLLRNSQGDKDFKDWIEYHNIQPQNVTPQCTYCIENRCDVLAHVTLNRDNGTGRDALFVVENTGAAVNPFKITQSYSDEQSIAQFRQNPDVTCEP